MKSTKLSFGFIFGILKQTASEWMEDNALRLSAALSYYSIFSIAPLLVIAIAMAGLFLDQAVINKGLEQELSKTMGPQAAQGVQAMVASTGKGASGIAAVVGFITLIFGATGVFGQLKDSLNTIWEVKAKPGLGIMGFVRDRFLSFGMVIVIGFLLLTSLMLTAALGMVSEKFGGMLPLPPVVWGVIGFIISFAVITVLFAAIFKLLPDVKLEWRDVWVGAVFTGLLFEIGKFLLGWYLGREGTASTYGAAAAVVLLLLWVYYASLIVLFGAEFTQVWARSHGTKIEPSDKAEPVTAEARAQQGLAPAGEGKPEPEKVYEPVLVPVGHLPEPVPFPKTIREVPNYLANEPAAALLTAIGTGFFFGLLSRATSRQPILQTPMQQVGSGSRALLADAGSQIGGALGRGLSRLRKILRG